MKKLILFSLTCLLFIVTQAQIVNTTYTIAGARDTSFVQNFSVTYQSSIMLTATTGTLGGSLDGKIYVTASDRLDRYTSVIDSITVAGSSAVYRLEKAYYPYEKLTLSYIANSITSGTISLNLVAFRLY